jgi:uncharacterized membrane protein YbhN (UPF0104 family)
VTRKRILNSVFVVIALVVTALAARHFASTRWPLRGANLWLVALAGVIFVVSYAAKAWGWQHLFRRGERPAVLTLAAAGGAASVGGIALPGRFDEVLRVAVVRRCRRPRASIASVVLSLFVLGLLDSVALTPFASVAAAIAHVNGWLQAGLIVIAAAGIAAAALILALPRLSRLNRLSRFRVAGWIGAHATSPRQAVWAWSGVAMSWTLRAVAIFVLLAALGFGSNFTLALAFLCASAASAVLPIAPAGAATQIGAGAGILVASGVHAERAIAFGIAAQSLVIFAGAAFVLALAAWHAQGRLALSARLARL